MARRKRSHRSSRRVRTSSSGGNQNAVPTSGRTAAMSNFGKKDRRGASRMSDHHIGYILLGIAGISLLAVGISVYLYCKHVGYCQSSFACVLGLDGVDGCKVLGESAYAKLLGIPIAWFGVVYYGLVATLASWIYLGKFAGAMKMSTDRFYILLSSLYILIEVGVAADVFLAAINFFVLPVICLLCFYTYLCQFVLMGLSIWMYKHVRPNLYKEKTFLYAWAPALMIWLVPALVVMLWFNLQTPADHLHAEEGNGQKQTQNIPPIISDNQIDKYLRELQAFARPAVVFDEVRTKVVKSSDSKGETQFSGKPYIKFVEYADYHCGYCFRFHLISEFLGERWPGRIESQHRFFPLDGSCNGQVQGKGDGASCYGALTSYCLAVQSPKNYAEYHNQLFQLQRRQIRISRPAVRTIASNLKLDFDKLDKCSKSPSTYNLLKADLQLAKQLGVTGTPTILLNGHALGSGLPNVPWLIAVVDALVLQKEGETAREEFSRRFAKP